MSQIALLHVNALTTIRSALLMNIISNEYNIVIGTYMFRDTSCAWKITASRGFKNGLQNCDIDLPSGRQ